MSWKHLMTEEKKKMWSRNFLLFWQGHFVSRLGDEIYSVALCFWILQETGSSTIMGIIVAIEILPHVFFAPISGVAADRYDRKRMMIGMDLICGVVASSIGFLALAGRLNVWMAAIGSLFLGTATNFFGPASASALHDLVPQNRIGQAKASMGTTLSAGKILGYSLGGILYSLLGAPLLLIFNGVTFLLSAASEIFIEISPVQGQGEKSAFFREIAQGYRYLRSKKGLIALTFMTMLTGFFFPIALASMIPLFERAEYLTVEQYGYVSGAMYVGTLLGMSVLSFQKIRRDLFLPIYLWRTIVASVSISLFPLMPNFLYMIPLLFIRGGVSSFGDPIFGVLVQENISPPMRGRFYSVYNAVTMALVPLGLFLSGVLCDLFPAKLVIFVSGILYGVPIVAIFLVPELKRMLDAPPVRDLSL